MHATKTLLLTLSLVFVLSDPLWGQASGGPSALQFSVQVQSLESIDFKRQVLASRENEWGLHSLEVPNAIHGDASLEYRRSFLHYGPYLRYANMHLSGDPEYPSLFDEGTVATGYFRLTVHQMIVGAHLGISWSSLRKQSEMEAKEAEVDFITRLRFGAGMSYFHRYYERYSYLEEELQKLRRTSGASSFHSAFEAEFRYRPYRSVMLKDGERIRRPGRWSVSLEAGIIGSRTARFSVHDVTDNLSSSYRLTFDWSGLTSGLRLGYYFGS